MDSAAEAGPKVTDHAATGEPARDYRVRLEAFEGPLDLLLYLTRRAEVDLTEIPIAEIAAQYMDYLEHIDRVDIDTAGEFLVMAATLMEIKSRLIGPPDEDGVQRSERVDPEDDTDPRAELVRQLLAYKAYRDAADQLEHRAIEWHRRAPAGKAAADETVLAEAMDELGELELDELDLNDLVDAFRAIAESVNFDRLGEHEVVSDDTPLEKHADAMSALLRSPEAGERRALPLRRVLMGKSRGEMVGRFLALLVLIRDQRAGVRAVDDGDGVEVFARDDADAETEHLGND